MTEHLAMSLPSLDLEWLVGIWMRAAVLLLVVLVLTRLLMRASARLRHLVWTTSLVCALALPVLSFVLPSWHLPLPDVEIAGVSPAPHLIDPTPVTDDALTRSQAASAPAAANTDVATPFAGGPEGPPAAWRPSFAQIVIALWLLGVAMATAYLFAGIAWTRRLAREASPLEDPTWLDTASTVKKRLGLSRDVALLVSPTAMSPVTWGWRKPVVCLPEDARTWSAERIEVVLQHELVHVRRNDWLAQMAGHLALILHWFNPLCWIALRRLAIEREQACDDEVIALGTRPSVYAGHLMEIARTMTRRRHRAVPALFMGRLSQFEGRLLAILAERARSRGRRVVMLPTALVVMALSVAVATAEPWGHLANDDASDVAVTHLLGSMSPVVVEWTEDDASYRIIVDTDVEFRDGAITAWALPDTGSIAVEVERDGVLERMVMADELEWWIDDEPQDPMTMPADYLDAAVARGLRTLALAGETVTPAGADVAAAHDMLLHAQAATVSLSNEHDAILETKVELVEQLDAIDAVTSDDVERWNALFEDIQVILEKERDLRAQIDPLDRRVESLHASGSTDLASVADEATSLDHELAELRTRLHELLAEQDAIQNVLDPQEQRMQRISFELNRHCDELLALEERMAIHYSSMIRSYTTLRRGLADALAVVIANELGHVLPDPAEERIEAAAGLARDLCSTGPVVIGEDRVWLQSSWGEVHRVLRRAFVDGALDETSLARAVDRVIDTRLGVGE